MLFITVDNMNLRYPCFPIPYMNDVTYFNDCITILLSR